MVVVSIETVLCTEASLKNWQMLRNKESPEKKKDDTRYKQKREETKETKGMG